MNHQRLSFSNVCLAAKGFGMWLAFHREDVRDGFPGSDAYEEAQRFLEPLRQQIPFLSNEERDQISATIRDYVNRTYNEA
jgi:hypothetical protein